MPFSLRLDPETEARIRRLVSKTGWPKSSVVREAIAHYANDIESSTASAKPSAFDRLRPYLGVVDSGGAQLSTDTHAKYRALLRRKARGRRPR
jgi:predicted DNA-binding protein